MSAFTAGRGSLARWVTFSHCAPWALRHCAVYCLGLEAHGVGTSGTMLMPMARAPGNATDRAYGLRVPLPPARLAGLVQSTSRDEPVVPPKPELARPKEAFAGGWFHTGDLAVLESDRYVKIKDRSKDIIISGGENISSIEVEDALYRHPAVMACAVVARPDPKWGESPVAYVETKADATVTAAELIAHCKSLLAGYKVPKEIRFEPIPKTSTGKIQKFQLRERAKSASAIE